MQKRSAQITARSAMALMCCHMFCLLCHVCFVLVHLLSPPWARHWLCSSCVFITLTCFKFTPSIIQCLTTYLYRAIFVLCYDSLVFGLVPSPRLCILDYPCHCILYIAQSLPVSWLKSNGITLHCTLQATLKN